MNDQAIVQKFWDRDEDAINDSKKQYEDYCLYIATVLFPFDTSIPTAFI